MVFASYVANSCADGQRNGMCVGFDRAQYPKAKLLNDSTEESRFDHK